MSGAASGGKGSSLPRADSHGQTQFRENSRHGGGEGQQANIIHQPLTTTPLELLTEHGHHLQPGAAWRMDTGRECWSCSGARLHGHGVILGSKPYVLDFVPHLWPCSWGTKGICSPGEEPHHQGQHSIVCSFRSVDLKAVLQQK